MTSNPDMGHEPVTDERGREQAIVLTGYDRRSVVTTLVCSLCGALYAQGVETTCPKKVLETTRPLRAG